MRILDTISDFFGRSSIPGVSRIAEFKSDCGRIIWLAVIFGSFIGFTIHLGLNIARYLEYAVVTQTIMNEVPFVFPDVTVCTQFPLSFARSKGRKTLPGGYSSDGNEFFYTIKDFWKSAQNLSKLGDFTRFDNVEARKSLDRYVDEFELLHERDEMIIDCVYKKQPCHAENFTEFLHPLLQKCQTFRPNDRVPNDNTPDDGLQLLVSTVDRRAILTDEEILFWLRGISVKLHQPGTAAVMSSKNIVIASGTHSHVSIDINKNIKIQKDSNQCLSTSEVKKRKLQLVWMDWQMQIKYEWSVDYSQSACRNLELQKYVLEKCGCLSEDYFVTKTIVDNYRKTHDLLRYCHMIDTEFITKPLKYYRNSDAENSETLVLLDSDSNRDKSAAANKTIRFWDWMPDRANEILSKHKCAQEIRHNQDVAKTSEVEDEISQKCPSPCSQYTYEPMLTSYVWPESVRNAKAALVKILSDPPKTLKHMETYKLAINTSLSDLEMLRDSFLKVDFFPDDMKGTLVEESYAYPASAFASDVGGVLGLWAGMSIITFIEIFSSCLEIANAKRKFTNKNAVGN